MTPATIVDPKTGKNVVSDKQTSYGMFFKLNENAFISRRDQRIFEIMNFPLEHGKGTQILYYPARTGSEPHFDFLIPSNPANQS
ncbi:hypothetical protein [Undibacterium sp. SXout20W]|uniref:hypothetical protein n=1 Tax=Undibacterium sp. SXout20W TaxID=3413051 RepID=UPI003BF26CF3